MPWQEDFLVSNGDWHSGWTQEKLQSTSQSQTCTKNCHSRSLLVSCWSVPLQLFGCDQQCFIWEIFFVSDGLHQERIGQHIGPNSSSSWQGMSTCWLRNTSNVEWIGLWSFSCSIYVHVVSSKLIMTASWLLTTILEENTHHEGGRKCFPKFVASWSTGFYASGL